MVAVSGNSKLIDVARKPVQDYVFEAIVSFNQGIDEVVIEGSGPWISKAVDVYRILSERLEDAIELVNIEIGSRRTRRGPRSYIRIVVRRSF